ncbi:MAG: hypothetical protein WA117_20960 [Verrucomicrobiia bacterium]
MPQPFLRGMTSVTGTVDPATVVQSNLNAINDIINYLIPDSASAGAPTTGAHAQYERWMDGDYVVWVCTAGGTPGTWLKFSEPPTP